MPSILLALVAVLFAGCASSDREPNAWTYTPSGPEEHWDKDCSGDFYFNGCDDCNPCTWDAWCDPAEWDTFVPEWCAAVAHVEEGVCVHFDRTTPEGQINDCFPIRPVTDVRAGRCCAGACVDNNTVCN